MAKREIKNPAQGLFNTEESNLAPASKATDTSIPNETMQSVSNDTNLNRSHSPVLVVPVNREVRSYRKQILLYPSIHKRAEIKCKQLNISMNEAINQLLQHWVEND